MEYYPAMKRNEIELFVMRWMDLECVIQSKVCQKEKKIPYANTYIYIYIYIYMESKKKMVLKNVGRTGIKMQM